MVVEVNGFFPYIHGENAIFSQFFVEHMQYKVTMKKGGAVMVPPPGSCGFLDKGRLKVSMTSEDGNEKVMWFLEEHNLVPNDMVMVFDKRLVADMDSEILYVNKEDFLNFILSDKEHLHVVIQQFYKRYALCVQERLSGSAQNCRTKVLRFIYQLAINYGKVNQAGQTVLDSLPSRNDIASITGVHRSNVTRYITELEKAGIVQKVKGNLIVHDMVALAQWIEDGEE